jgi:hypothetical protein
VIGHPVSDNRTVKGPRAFNVPGFADKYRQLFEMIPICSS